MTGMNITRSTIICWMRLSTCWRTRGLVSFTCSANSPSMSGALP